MSAVGVKLSIELFDLLSDFVSVDIRACSVHLNDLSQPMETFNQTIISTQVTIWHQIIILRRSVPFNNGTLDRQALLKCSFMSLTYKSTFNIDERFFTKRFGLNNILFENMVILHTLYIHNYRIGKQVNHLY